MFQFVLVLCTVKFQKPTNFLTFRLPVKLPGLRSGRTAFFAPSQEGTHLKQHFKMTVLCAGTVSKPCRAWPVLLSGVVPLLCL